MPINRLILTVVLFATCSLARGDDVDSNPYVALYKNRVEMAKGAVASQRAVAAYEQKHYERIQSLFAQNVSTQEELQESKSRVAVAELAVQDLELKVVEAQNLLDISRLRATAGGDMPICTPVVSH